MLLNNSVRQGDFPNTRKMAKIHTLLKNSKQIVDNYRQVSLLTISSNIFENLLFDTVYEFLDEICLSNSN